MPTARRRRGQQRQDPQQSVDPHLEDDAREQGGDVRGRVGVRGGQPEVQGYDPRLETEAEQREQEQDARDARPARPGRERLELERARGRPQQTEQREQGERARVRRHQVDPTGLLHLAPIVLGGHEQERRERHDLPCEQEGDAVGREHDTRRVTRSARRTRAAACDRSRDARPGASSALHRACPPRRARRRAPGRRPRAGRAADAARARGARPGSGRGLDHAPAQGDQRRQRTEERARDEQQRSRCPDPRAERRPKARPGTPLTAVSRIAARLRSRHHGSLSPAPRLRLRARRRRSLRGKPGSEPPP